MSLSDEVSDDLVHPSEKEEKKNQLFTWIVNQRISNAAWINVLKQKVEVFMTNQSFSNSLILTVFSFLFMYVLQISHTSLLI